MGSSLPRDSVGNCKLYLTLNHLDSLTDNRKAIAGNLENCAEVLLELYIFPSADKRGINTMRCGQFLTNFEVRHCPVFDISSIN